MSGGGGAPAVQAQYSYSSPFQNPAYNAVAMGTKQSPGPVARSIQIGNQLAQNWQDSYTGANPGAYYGITKEQATPQFLANQRLQQGAWSPPNSQTAAGVNQFDPDRNRTIAVANPNLSTQTAAQGGLMSLGNFDRGRSSDSEAVNPQSFAAGGAARPKYTNKTSAEDKLKALQTAVNAGYKPKPAETTFMQGMADSAAVRQQLGSDVPYSIDPKTGAIKPAARGANQSSAEYAKYLGQLDTAGATLDPKVTKQYGVQTGATTQKQNQTSGVNAPYSMQQAVEQKTAYYDPTTGQSTNPLFNQAVSRIQDAQKLPEQFGQATDAYNKGISGLAGLSNYQPQNVTAQQLSAAQYGAQNMAAPEEARVQDYTAAQAGLNQMTQPEDVVGQGYTAADISPTAREQGVTTAAPKSWTDAGVAQQYMNPYQQNVTNIAKRESMRDYGQQMSQLKSQAAKSKAYGGTRAAVQEAEAQRNQAQRLGDIESQGLNQAYQSGMGQFQAEQGLGSQVGMSNTAQINQLKSQYMSMGLTEAQANQAAQNQAAQYSAGNMQQAALANQQAGLTTGQANLTAAQQTAMANQTATNQQRQQYVNNALQAAMQSYGGQLTAAQQNQVAQNAAGQWNANSQNQIGLANQQTGLQAGMANQQAGLQANQQNLSAYNSMLSGAQGLGSLGGLQSQTNLANIGALGQAAQAQQNLGQQYLTGVQQSAQNYFNWPQQQLSAPINAINQLPSSGGATTQTQRPASALGWKKGGLMNLRKARRA